MISTLHRRPAVGCPSPQSIDGPELFLTSSIMLLFHLANMTVLSNDGLKHIYNVCKVKHDISQKVYGHYFDKRVINLELTEVLSINGIN